jgi:hypothetical protein
MKYKGGMKEEGDMDMNVAWKRKYLQNLHYSNDIFDISNNVLTKSAQ